jgi:hypothetical protein
MPLLIIIIVILGEDTEGAAADVHRWFKLTGLRMGKLYSGNLMMSGDFRRTEG